MRIVAVHIEGLGQIDGSGQSEGYLFTTGLPSGFDDTTNSYDWRPVIPEAPDGGETKSEPFSDRFRFSSLDLTLSVGNAQDWLAELLFYKQTNATTSLNEAVQVTSSDPTLTVVDPTDLSAGEVIYIGAETILIDSITGNDLSVTRGYYGSETAPHGATDSIYTRPPFFEGRRCIIYTYDLSDNAPSLVSRDWGVIDGAVSMSGAAMRVPVRSIFAPITRAKVNRNPVIAADHDLQRLSVPEDADEFAGLTSYTGTVYAGTFPSGVLKSAAGASSKYTWWDVDGELYLASGGKLRHRPFATGRKDARFSSALASRLGGPASLDRPPAEVFAVVRSTDRDIGSIASSTREIISIPNTFTLNGESYDVTADKQSYYYHPLVIFACIAFSTPRSTSAGAYERFDILESPNFGMDLLPLFDDEILNTIHDLILSPIGQTQQVDRFVLGAGGDSVEFIKVAQQKLLDPYGYKIGITKEGKLDIFRAELPGVASYAQARANELSPIGGPQGIYDVDNGQNSAVDVIEAKVGATAYTPGRSITLRADDGQPDRAFALRGGPESELDLSTLDPIENANEAESRIISRALAVHFASKRMTVKVPDWREQGLDYGLGKFCTLDGIRIEDAYLTDQNGDRVRAIDSSVEWVGQIIGRRPLDQYSGYVLELIFNSSNIIRYRAPSGVVDSSTTSSVTLKSTFVGDDAEEFNPGDEIVVYTPSGAVVDDTGVVDTVSGNTINITGTWSTSPSELQYVRLAALERYENTTIDTYTARVYVYMSDADATIGTDETDSDIYGL